MNDVETTRTTRTTLFLQQCINNTLKYTIFDTIQKKNVELYLLLPLAGQAVNMLLNRVTSVVQRSFIYKYMYICICSLM